MKRTFSPSLILLSVIFMDLLTGMEFDLFVPSFPQLQQHFELSPFWVEALLSINFLGYCLSLFFVGVLADRYGRKPIILLGLITFVMGSIFCLFDTSYLFLLFGRFLQGAGIAAPAALSFLVIADIYSLKEQQFLMAMLNASLNVAAAIAPVIGSFLTLYFHWQGNFFALLILGLIVLCMAIFFIPRYEQLNHIASLSLRDYSVIFKSKPLMLLMINLLFIFTPYWIFVGISPLLYIKDLGVSLAHFGYYQGVLAFVFAMGSVIFGLMIRTESYNQKNTLFVATLILIASFVVTACATFANSANPLFITFAMLIFVIGQIIPSTILYPFCLNFMPQAKGRVSAVLQGGRLIFTALSLQIVGYFYQGSFREIGFLLIIFIAIGIVTLFFVSKNRELMDKL